MENGDKDNCIPATVGVLTFNSEENLARCLESVKLFCEIVVSDGGSTDGTLDIAREYGAKIIKQSVQGKPIADFSKERNRLLNAASHDWFIYIDTDEFASLALVQKVREIARNPHPHYLVYRVPYHIKSADLSRTYTQFKTYYQMRLFNKRTGARFIKKMHEKITFDESIPVGQIEAPWYGTLPEEALIFSKYRKKAHYRITKMIEKKRIDTFAAYFRRVLRPLEDAIKQVIKIIYLRLRYPWNRLIPLKYELFRLYSYLYTAAKITQRFLWVLRRKLFLKTPFVVWLDSETWDRQFKVGRWEFLLDLDDQVHIKKIASVIHETKREKGTAVFDVGCGNGALLTALRIRGLDGIEYHGLDWSQEAIASIKIKNDENITLYLADIENPPHIDQKFDVIVFAEVLYYVDVSHVLEQYQKYLKPWGLIIASMHYSWRSYLKWWSVGRNIGIREVYHTNSPDNRVSWTIKVGMYKK